ncbi:hypothetical protein Y032_0038g3619 [Ancylostoma ceylanicum]|uniref:guanylate cyclase n=1 Tax=Ancylostoma ceylanicum TaxID=53326 RepID=A0A016UJT3_9BILA|nr:hypothetical protein Y032_0038g3619 [Ancylostoma ceylanicum]
MTTSGIKAVLDNVAKRARIVVTCLAEGYGYKRALILTAIDAGYFNDEYVYIFADPNANGFFVPLPGGGRRPVWVDPKTPSDGRDNEALQAFLKVMAVSSASQYAGQLHDAFYAYAKSLNATLSKDANAVGNGTALLENILLDFEGASGHVVIGENGTRNPTFYINGLASNEEAMSFAYVFVSGINATYSALYRDESRIWSSRGGIRPAAVPKCGFEGKQCPPDFVSTYLLWIIIGGAVLVICILGCVAGIIVTILNKRAEMARLNELWQIPFTSLAVLANKDKSMSHRSLQSNVASNKFSMDGRSESRNYAFFLYQKEPVAAMKHEIRINFDSREAAAFRMMRQIENENVNRFIGICIDGPQMMSIWRNCSRGSINDVIMKGALMMDNFFVVSLLKDIASGISYIHHSFLVCHGYITSKCCVVNDRWQVKVSDYGIDKLRIADKRTHRDLLWTAPEILRTSISGKSQEGDVYSFGIVCAQVVTRSSPWDLDNRKEDPEELIYMVKKGGHNALRPPLDVHENNDVNLALVEFQSTFLKFNIERAEISKGSICRNPRLKCEGEVGKNRLPVDLTIELSSSRKFILNAGD